MLGKTLADLQSNISISAQNAVTGDINWVTGYTGFSSNFREQAGWYIALKIDASTIEGALEGATIVATYHGRDVTLDSDQIIIIRLADGEDTITFTANKEGYTEGRLTLDFSGLDKQEVNQSVYLTSDTTGITISPMQFGNTKTISGQVPWDSTTNSNVMELTAYPFFDVPSGTTYSLEGTYNGVGANIQITDGTFSDLDEVSMTFSVPSEMIGQTGATFILMFEDPDNNRDYFTYDVTGLTLAPDPRYKFAINNTTTGVTFTPNNTLQLNGATTVATGVIPYDTTASTPGNYLTGTVTTNKPVQGTGPNVDYGLIYLDGVYTNQIDFTPGDNPGVANYSVNITAPFTTMTIEIWNPDGSEVYCTQTINGSALTLAPDPTPRINVTSDTTGVTITPATYNTSKTATGQVPYDTTTQKNILSVALTTSGTLPTGPYTIEVFAQGDVMQQPIWYTTGASTIPQSIPIPLTSNEVGTGKYITANFSGVNDSEFIIVTINTSALTLEAAPTPPTPSAPDFDIYGVEDGVGDEDYYFFAGRALSGDTGYSHKINFDDACCIDIAYNSATTVSGHTQYNYSASSSTYYHGIYYWQSPTDGIMIEWANGLGGCTIMTRATNTNDLFNKTSPLQPTSGEFLSGIAGSSSLQGQNFSSQINAFGMFDLDFDGSSSPYHYVLRDSTSPSGQKVDISDKYHMIFAIAGANGTTIPQNDIVFKLYNSSGTDYIIINIDMSNVTAQRWPHYTT